MRYINVQPVVNSKSFLLLKFCVTLKFKHDFIFFANWLTLTFNLIAKCSGACGEWELYFRNEIGEFIKKFKLYNFHMLLLIPG